MTKEGYKSDMKYVCALSIAGSDSSGGAGIQADIKAMSALGVYAATAITAITVQNTTGVTAVAAVPPEIVAGQIRAVMEDIEPKAVKIGMVNDVDTIQAIATTLRAYPPAYLVVDPVMVATSGSRLMQPDALAVFERELLPMATLLTPNIPEAELLSGMRIDTPEKMATAAQVILAKGCQAVLIKGGHLQGTIKADRLFLANGEQSIFQSPHVETRNTHGTGCTLSSAITARLALGDSLTDALFQAKLYLSEALCKGASVCIGKGHGPVNHFYQPQPLHILP